jgi:hypothetical protein
MPTLTRALQAAALLDLLLAAACTGGPAAQPLVEGDPWEYNLTLADMPPGFEQEFFDLESGVITNRDVSLTAGDPSLFAAANAQGRLFGHFAEFTGNSAQAFNHVASLVVVYRTPEGAAAGLAESVPGPDPDMVWTEMPDAAQVGDEARLWTMLVPDSEAVYRVDFRYRNVKASVGVSGPPESVPGPQPALDFARTLLARFQAEPLPAPLADLRRAHLPDLRGLALTQEDLIELDPVNGVVWFYDDNPLPQWTPRSDGPVAGYQVNFYRPVAREDVQTRLPYQMVVTVLAYPSEAEAAGALAGAVGPDNGQKIPLEPAGEESLGFFRAEAVRFLDQTQPAGVYEINLRQGVFVAGVRVVGFQPLDADPLDPNPATAFLHAFALRQAERLAAAR